MTSSEDAHKASMCMSDSPSSDDRYKLDFYDNTRRLLLPMSALLSLSVEDGGK